MVFSIIHSFFAGVRDDGNTGFSANDTRRFKFIDGSTVGEDFFHVNNGKDPWLNMNPSGDGDCIV